MHKSLSPKLCKVDGCTGRYKASGYCSTHYNRLRVGQNKDLAKPKYFRPTRVHLDNETCKLKTCDKKADTKHLCKVHYGITLKFHVNPETYVKMHEDQDYKCAICRKPSQSKYGLHVDHDHSSQNVRELLCGHCNSLLGFARDNPEILKTAIEYLRSHQETPLYAVR